jgi:uncharacterized protein with GYD domain
VVLDVQPVRVRINDAGLDRRAGAESTQAIAQFGATSKKGGIVPTYVLLSTLTTEGGQTLHAHPERMEQVNREISEFGCSVVSQYALLGAYDFLTVVEAPDNETVAHLSVDLGSRGTVKVTTLPAIPIDSFVKKLGGDQQMGKG